MYRIQVNHHGQPVTDFRIGSHRVTVGSDEACDVCLDAEKRVEPLHAVLEQKDSGEWTITPAEEAKIISRGESIGADHKLQVGDSFLIGEFVISWQEAEEPDVDEEEAEEPTLPAVDHPRLRVVGGAEKGRIIDLPEDLSENSAALGRAEDNTVVFVDRSVSRHHATITEDERGYLLKDENSSYGVRAGGGEVDNLRLLNGTAFALGDTELVFEAPVRPLSPEEAARAEQELRDSKEIYVSTVETAPPGEHLQAAARAALDERRKSDEVRAAPETGSRMNPALWPLMILLLVCIFLILLAAVGVMYL